MTNFKGVDHERIENLYESFLYSGDMSDPVIILKAIQEKLLEEQNETP